MNTKDPLDPHESQLIPNRRSLQFISAHSMEAFLDAVLAIIITIQVLDLHVPEVDSAHLNATIISMWPKFLVYLISFIYLANFWNYDRLFLNGLSRFNRQSTWLFLFHIFFLSLVPFVTSLQATHWHQALPNVFFGVNLFMVMTFYALTYVYMHKNNLHHKKERFIYLADYADIVFGQSIILVNIILSFFFPFIAFWIYAFLAFLFLPIGLNGFREKSIEFLIRILFKEKKSS